MTACAHLGAGGEPWQVLDGSPPVTFPAPVPAGFPVPAVPADNPQTIEKAELGRHLFYDRRLSINGRSSCASCHRQELAFTDRRTRAVGATGGVHPRNSMSLTNVAYNASFTWADPETRTLEDQARVPMFNRHPIELGIDGHEEEILARLRADDAYRRLFAAAYPGRDDPIEVETVVQAIAAFERTLLSGDSAYDRLVRGENPNALDAEARRGMDLFFSERAGCSGCHHGFNFSGPVRFHEFEPTALAFHNTGLYDFRRDRERLASLGLHEHTTRRRDLGAFRAPTLRNIERTAPYMHDGSVATLEEVLDHYAAGGRSAARGGRTPFRSRRIRPLDLDEEERAALVAFLRSLTDEAFLSDPRFANPWPDSPTVRAHALP